MWIRRQHPSPSGPQLRSPKRSHPKPLARPRLFVAAALVGIGLLRCLLFVNPASESMPRGLYLLRIRPPGQPPSRLALFCLPEDLARFGRARGYLGPGLCPGWAAALIKPIVARPGDRVVIGSDGVRVEGHLLPHSAPRRLDSSGRPIPATSRRSFVVPPHRFLAVSSHTARSWDGRYWGPLPESLIRGPATLLYTPDPGTLPGVGPSPRRP